jgi:hypothetical protein
VPWWPGVSFALNWGAAYMPVRSSCAWLYSDRRFLYSDGASSRIRIGTLASTSSLVSRKTENDRPVADQRRGLHRTASCARPGITSFHFVPSLTEWPVPESRVRHRVSSMPNLRQFRWACLLLLSLLFGMEKNAEVMISKAEDARRPSHPAGNMYVPCRVVLKADGDSGSSDVTERRSRRSETTTPYEFVARS